MGGSNRAGEGNLLGRKEGNFMQKTVSGPFTVRNLSAGAWQLTSQAGVEVLLRGAGAAAPEILQGQSLAAVSLEWSSDAVRVTTRGAEGVGSLVSRSALVHEPRPRLYEHLPLANFDADAQRFWRRIFGLIRIPGGRYFLRFIARRGRGKPRNAKT
jgi:hypothetical protein